MLGLLAAVSRIAAILPSDLAPTNMNGPKLPFVAGLVAAVQLPQSSHWDILQHFDATNGGSAGQSELSLHWSLGPLLVNLAVFCRLKSFSKCIACDRLFDEGCMVGNDLFSG